MSWKYRAKGQHKGFTLIEILIAVGIIAILAGLGMVNLFQAMQRAKRSSAQAFIAELETAINMYKIDVGRYPPDDDDWSGSSSLREALENDHPGDEGWNGPYLEFKDREINNRGELLDPWHKGKDDTLHVYDYRANIAASAFHNRSSYDIYCKGFDGKTGSRFYAGNYCQNEVDDDGDGIVDELDPNGPGAANGYLEDDVNNW